MREEIPRYKPWLLTGITVSRHEPCPITNAPCPITNNAVNMALIMHGSSSVWRGRRRKRFPIGLANRKRSRLVDPRGCLLAARMFPGRRQFRRQLRIPKLLPNALDCSQSCKRSRELHALLREACLPLVNLGISKTVITCLLPARDVGTLALSRALAQGEPSNFRATCQARCNLPARRRTESCSGNRFCRPKARSLASDRARQRTVSRFIIHASTTAQAASTSRRSD